MLNHINSDEFGIQQFKTISVPVDVGNWFWIGASFNEQEDAWFWVPEPVITSLWRAEEPDGGSGKNCMCFHKFSFTMFSGWCLFERYPLCEMP